MLLPENINPNNTLYLNGAMILITLRRVGKSSLMDLFFDSQNTQEISMPLFVLSLDWLFLSSCIQKDSNGEFSICS